MSSKNLVRLRWFTYLSFIGLWATAIYLLKTDRVHFFSALDWIAYFTIVLACVTGGAIVLFWQHRRSKNPRPPYGGYRLNWTAEDGIFAPRETRFVSRYGEQDMVSWLRSQ